MAELNPVEHVAKIFAVAQKLMKARQDSALARIVAEAAAKELAQINGGTERIDLSDYDGRRFFECIGDRNTRLAYGDSTAAARDLKSDPNWKCPAIISFESWQLTRDSEPETESLLCRDCQHAKKLADKDREPKTETAPAEVPAKKAKTKQTEGAF